MSDKDYVARVQSVAALQEMLNKKYYQQIADELSKTQKCQYQQMRLRITLKKYRRLMGYQKK